MIVRKYVPVEEMNVIQLMSKREHLVDEQSNLKCREPWEEREFEILQDEIDEIDLLLNIDEAML